MLQTGTKKIAAVTTLLFASGGAFHLLLQGMTISSPMTIGTIAASTTLVGCEEADSGSDGSSSSSSANADGAVAPTTSGLQAIDAQKLCARLINECGQAQSMAECTANFGVLRVTSACISKINGGTCGDLTSSTSAVLTSCFPPCTGAPAACNPDGTLTFCAATGVTQIASCQDSCKVQGTTFTGTCAKSFEGEVAAQAQCWCK